MVVGPVVVVVPGSVVVVVGCVVEVDVVVVGCVVEVDVVVVGRVDVVVVGCVDVVVVGRVVDVVVEEVVVVLQFGGRFTVQRADVPCPSPLSNGATAKAKTKTSVSLRSGHALEPENSYPLAAVKAPEATGTLSKRITMFGLPEPGPPVCNHERAVQLIVTTPLVQTTSATTYGWVALAGRTGPITPKTAANVNKMTPIAAICRADTRGAV